MENNELGRVPLAPGSHEPSPDGLGPSGFDPSRVAASLSVSQVRALLAMPFNSYKTGFQPSTLISLKHPSAGTNYGEPRPALSVERRDVAHCRRYLLTEAGDKVVKVLRDRDRSGEADETWNAAQPEARARAEGIAQDTPSYPVSIPIE